MSTERLGIGDKPVQVGGRELLGIGSYAQALKEFIAECDTPLTIGIQGDWGSGKTSLMNLIRPADDDASQAAVWVNTWKYAQLGEPETLFLAVLSGVVEGLAAKVQGDKGTERRDKAMTLLRQSFRVAARAGAQALGVDLETIRDAANDTPAHQLVDELKEALRQLIKAATENRDRVVLFVDDLDRIPPVRAVQILEALKNFLDVSDLVTVLACDYAVISKGLASRVGVSEEALGRSFFDKIIQVPFRMPTHAYNASGYVQELLRRVDVPISDIELEYVTEVLRNSVGLNPRTLKRHANSLLLLIKVAKHTPGLRDSITQDRRPLVMLALTAMEAKYPKMHRYMARRLESDPASPEVRAMVQDGKLPDPMTAPWVSQYQEAAEGDGETVVDLRLRGFLHALQKLVDANNDGTVDDNELHLLKEMLHLSSVSSVDTRARIPKPRRRTKWTREEFLAALTEGDADPDVQELTRALLELAHQLRDEGLVRLDWGKGVVKGTCSIKAGRCNLLSIWSSGATNINAGYWGILPEECLELAALLDALLGTGVHAAFLDGKEVYPDVTADLLERDPDLSGFESWLRNALLIIGS